MTPSLRSSNGASRRIFQWDRSTNLGEAACVFRVRDFSFALRLYVRIALLSCLYRMGGQGEPPLPSVRIGTAVFVSPDTGTQNANAYYGTSTTSTDGLSAITGVATPIPPEIVALARALHANDSTANPQPRFHLPIRPQQYRKRMDLWPVERRARRADRQIGHSLRPSATVGAFVAPNTERHCECSTRHLQSHAGAIPGLDRRSRRPGPPARCCPVAAFLAA